MKKLIILVSLIALLASGMVFAEVTLNGKVELEVANDFDSDEGADAPNLEKWDPDTRVEFNIKVDEFNTGYIRARLNDAALSGITEKNLGGTDVNSDGDTKDAYSLGNRYIYFDKAYITTNMTGAMGMNTAPFKWTSQIGLNEWKSTDVATADWDITNAVLLRNTSYSTYFYDEKLTGTKQTIGNDMFSFGAFFGLEYETLQDWYIDGILMVPAGPGKLSAEVAYMVWSNTTAAPGMTGTVDSGEGTMLLSLGYDTKVNDLTVKAGASYYLPLDTEVSYSAYAANAKVSMGTTYGLVGLQGYPEDDDLGMDAQIIHNVRIAAGAMILPVLGVDVGAILYLGGEDKVAGDDREVLNTLDMSAYVKAGKATYRVGYIFVPDDDISIDPFKTDSIKKSLYLVANLAF